MSLSLAARRARLLAIRSLIDADGGGAVWLLGGTQAANAETAPATAPLAIISLAEVSFDMHATEAEMNLVQVTGNAAAQGQPTWVRFVDGGGVGIMDQPAGLPGSGMPVIITNGEEPPGNQIWTGGVITVNLKMTEPA